MGGGGGYPSQVQTGGPQPGPDGGGGYPGQVQTGGGVPQPGPDRGVLVPPPPRYRTTDGVLDTPRSVCLLRSRRRTFLLNNETLQYTL